MPKNVVFSNRAFAALLAETKENITTETGGVFLGIKGDDVWYVIEAIDPGPKSIFQTAYFEYDGDYVRHLANKLNRLYGEQLDVLGLWHRHPGSMDTFSTTDNGTNAEFAGLNDGITISAIVNVDPDFRLTLYTAEINPLRYNKIGYETDDSKIPEDVRTIAFFKDIENQINEISHKKQNPAKGLWQKRKKTGFLKELDKYLKSLEQYKGKHIELLRNDDADLDFIIDNFLVDEIMFCEDNGIAYVFDSGTENKAKLTIGEEDSGLKLSFYMAALPDEEDSGKQPFFTHKGRLYLYKGNLLKSVWEENKK